jgi:monoamine oxidase
VLVSGYTEERSSWQGLTLEQKLAESRKSIERLHPGHGKELEKPMYVSWGQIPHNEGSWIRAYGPGQERWRPFGLARQTGEAQHPAAARTQTNPGYETLIEPDGPIIFAGDHVSHIVAWQEGAALSALRAVGQVNEKVKAARLAGGFS